MTQQFPSGYIPPAKAQVRPPESSWSERTTVSSSLAGCKAKGCKQEASRGPLSRGGRDLLHRLVGGAGGGVAGGGGRAPPRGGASRQRRVVAPHVCEASRCESAWARRGPGAYRARCLCLAALAAGSYEWPLPPPPSCARSSAPASLSPGPRRARALRPRVSVRPPHSRPGSAASPRPCHAAQNPARRGSVDWEGVPAVVWARGAPEAPPLRIVPAGAWREPGWFCGSAVPAPPPALLAGPRRRRALPPPRGAVSPRISVPLLPFFAPEAP